MKYLLISHNAFSNSNANGRVLTSLFSSIDEKNIAQLFIQNELPTTYPNCSYYKITDNVRLKGFFRGCIGQIIDGSKSNDRVFKSNEKNLIKKSSLRTSSFGALIRNFIWKYGKFDYSHLYNWVRSFNPDVIIFQSGRTPFLCDLTREIAIHFNIPVILFSTEDEYFHHPRSLHFLYNIHLKILRKSYKLLYKNVVAQILIQDELRDLYYKEFHKPSYTIMMGSSLPKKVSEVPNKTENFLYAGNLDRDRHHQILEIADSLFKQTNGKIKLNVIPSGVSNKIINKLKKHHNIVLKQYLPYSEYVEELNNADILFFVDSFSKKYKDIIKETFTGKTADYLSAGKIIFVYSPEYVYTNKYFRENPGTAIVASNINELNECLSNLLTGKYNLETLSKKSIDLFMKNHDIGKNAIKFKAITEEVVNNYEKNSSN